MEDPPFIGDWYCERKLGSGGFGVVTLWKNKKSQETVAIKKCHMPEGPPQTIEKFCERWENEVHLMTELIKNENIVSTIKVKPESFMQELMKTNPSKMKLLVMEYCEGGDLRKVLHRSHNSSGLKESEVRAILKSLSNAISYLHSQKITHRDIKPENIVLKKYGEDITVYKITDLGYARALDIQSLNASIVGTMEYLAPELIHNGRYNNSVDYWSMGVIAFEIICGIRPFIPHASIAQWILQLKQKSSEHICITEDNDGKYEYINKVFPENRISSCLKKSLEKWLMLALEWNPKQRGHVFEFVTDNEKKNSATSSATANTGVKPKSVKFADSVDLAIPQAPIQILKIFTMLDQIFEMKVLTLFCLYTHEFLSYQIDDNTSMSMLYEWIEEETGIPKSEIEFILPLEQAISEIDKTTKPIELYLSNYYENPMLYVIKKPALVSRTTELVLNDKITPKIPCLIQNLLQNDKVKLKPHILKQYANNCYYFIKNEKKLYETLMDGIKNYILLLDHEISIYKSKISEMVRMGFGVRGSLEIFMTTYVKCKQKLSAKNLDNLTQNYIIWDEQNFKLKSNLAKLCDALDKIVTRYESVLRRSKENISNKVVEKKEWESFDMNLLEKLYEELRMELHNKMNDEKSHKKLLTYIYESLKKRDALLRNKEFITLQKTIIEIKIEMEQIKRAVEKATQQADKYKMELLKLNSDLLDNVWETLEQFNRPTDILIQNGYSDIPDFTRMLSQINLTESASRSPSFKVGAAVTGNLEHKSLEKNQLLCFGEGPDLESLIADNESLMNATDDLIDDGFKSLVSDWSLQPSANNI